MTGGNTDNVLVDADGGALYAGSPQGVLRYDYDDAAERGGDGLLRQLSGLILPVQIRRDRVAAAPGRRAATA